MGTSRPATSTLIDRATAAVLVAQGRASAANVVIESALQRIDDARELGDIRVSDIEREKLSRLMLEVGCKVVEFQRALNELLAGQAGPQS